MTTTPSDPTPPETDRLDQLDDDIKQVRQRIRAESHEGERHFIDEGPSEHGVDDSIAPPG